jgi:hypothetical protein
MLTGSQTNEKPSAQDTVILSGHNRLMMMMMMMMIIINNVTVSIQFVND